MRSLTNKTAMMTNDAMVCKLLFKLNTKTYQFTKLYKSDWVIYQKQQISFFSEKLIQRTDVKAISSFHQLFWKKDFCYFGYMTQWFTDMFTGFGDTSEGMPNIPNGHVT